MFEGDYELTFEEEAQIEQPANIYSIVRTLDFIEWAFNSGHIDKENYMEHSNTILDQYKTSVDAYQDKFAGIDAFAQKYGLSDFKLGINRLKQGAVQISANTNTVSILKFIKLTKYQIFHKLKFYLNSLSIFLLKHLHNFFH
jgi:hypothetical protein